MNLISWMNRHFKVANYSYPEVTMECPKCNHSRLYFNVSKKVGFCQRASCHWTPSLKDFIERVGYGPEDDYVPYVKTSKYTDASIEFPEECEPLVIYENGKYYTDYPHAVENIKKRHLTDKDIYSYNLHWNGNRVFIPVYLNGAMVSYVGRKAWWFESLGLRYDYPKGAPVSRYLFAYDRDWETGMNTRLPFQCKL